MKTNSWIRVEQIDETYQEMYGIKPEVHTLRVDGKTFQTKLKLGEKEIILTEILEHGLTKEATMEYNGERFSFKRVIDAELAANNILKKKEEKIDGNHS